LQTSEGCLQTSESQSQTCEDRLQTCEGRLQTCAGRSQTCAGRLQTSEGCLQTSESQSQTCEDRLQTCEGRLQTCEGRFDKRASRFQGTTSRNRPPPTAASGEIHAANSPRTRAPSSPRMLAVLRSRFHGAACPDAKSALRFRGSGGLATQRGVRGILPGGVQGAAPLAVGSPRALGRALGPGSGRGGPGGRATLARLGVGRGGPPPCRCTTERNPLATLYHCR
jgi:hypothetical protein